MTQIILDTINFDKEAIRNKSFTTKTNIQYSILECVNNTTNVSSLNNQYRSVIMDPESKIVLSYSPPNELPFDHFQNSYPNLNTKEFQVSEMIEGIMIQLFYDYRIGKWEIATKSAVGCDYWYFRTQYNDDTTVKQLTFRDMFLDAMGSNTLY